MTRSRDADRARAPSAAGARGRARGPAATRGPELFVSDDPALARAVRRSTEENVDQIMAALRRPDALPHALGPGPRLEADVAAQHGAPVGALLRTYRLGQHIVAELLMEELTGAPLRDATRTLFHYTEAMMPLVATEYQAESARLESMPELRRLRPIQAVLAGHDVAPGLDHPLAGPHTAVFTDPGAAPAITAAGAALGAATLVLQPPGGACWGG